MALSHGQFRRHLGLFATGIAVVTGGVKCDDQILGVTINSFSSVSLDPPLVLFSLDKKSSSHKAFSKMKKFCIHILSENQKHLAEHFAKRSNSFEGIDHHLGDDFIPCLHHCLTSFYCRLYRQDDGGDHTIFLGEVEKIIEGQTQRNPLIYYASQYQSLLS